MEKRIELKLWIALFVVLLAFSCAAFGQSLNPTYQSVTYSELGSFPSVRDGRVFKYQDSLWFDNGITFINLSRPSSSFNLTNGKGTTASGTAVDLGGQIGNAVISIMNDSTLTIGDSSNYGLKIYNRNDSTIEVDLYSGYRDSETNQTSAGIVCTPDNIILQSTNADGSVIKTLNFDTTGMYYEQTPDFNDFSDNHFTTVGYIDNLLNSAETVSRTIYVATTGSDVTGDGSVGSPYATYAKAVSSIKPIVNYNVVITIDIAAGTYNEDFVEIDKYFSKIYWSKSSSFIVNGKFTTDVSGLTITTAGGSTPYVYNVTGGTFTANQYQDYFMTNGTTWYPIVYNGVSTINSNVGATSCTSIVHNTVIFNVTNGNMFVNSQILANGQTFEFNNIDINYAGAFIFSNNILLDVNKSKITCTNGQLALANYRNNFTSCAFVNSTSSFTLNASRVQFKQCSIRKSGSLTGTGLAVNNNYYSVPIIGAGGLYLYNWSVAWASQSAYCFNNQAGALVIDGCTTGFTFRNNSLHQWTSASVVYVNSVTTLLVHGETLERNYQFYINTLTGTPTTMFGAGITTNGLCNLSKNIHIEIPSVPTQGTATLVAGTVTISTAAVQAGSEILVSCKTPGGTQGFLSTGTITAGTSFVVNSSSATDTSTILWQIVK